jgi:hypothetical protein
MVLALLLALPTASAAELHDVPLPRGARSISPNLFNSSRGFRKTVEHFERWFRRSGLGHTAIPITRYRGVVVARFISEHPTSKWLAIHVFRAEGRTQIYIVPRPAKPPAPTPPAASS